MIDYGKYVGIQFLDKGRSFTGVDCFGLVRLIAYVEFGIEMDDYSSTYSTCEDSSSVQRALDTNRGKEQAYEVTSPRAGDVVMFKLRNVVCHMGMMIDDKRFIHSIKGCNSCVEKIDSLKWSKRIDSFWRFNEEI